MKTAQEFREIALRAKEAKDAHNREMAEEEIKNKIIPYIENASSIGMFYINYKPSHRRPAFIADRLKQLGFQVTETEDNNFCISWE